jgi:DNA-directed RNA polymerase specialized sigma24 family protein
LKLHYKFKTIVEKYSNKVYNFYYNVIKNHDICRDLIEECFLRINTRLINGEDFDHYLIYRIAVEVLYDNESYFTRKIVYYDFKFQDDFSLKIKSDFGIDINSIDFCFLKLALEDKIILILKEKFKFQDWEIAYILEVREKVLIEKLATARAKVINLLT